MTIIETDARSRVVLTGHPSERFILRENSDGSLFLEPAVVLTRFQYEYDTDTAFREQLDRAVASPSSTRKPRSRHSL